MAKQHSFFNWLLGKKITLRKYNKNTIRVFVKGEWKKYSINKIEYLKSFGCYCTIHFSDKSKVVSSLGMAHYASQLPVNHFGRYHNSFVFNRWCVVDYNNKGIWKVELKSGKTLPISENCETEFKDDFFEFRKQTQ